MIYKWGGVGGAYYLNIIFPQCNVPLPPPCLFGVTN